MRKLTTIAVAVVLFSSGAVTPARAAVPPPQPAGASIQRSITLNSSVPQGSSAWLIPTGSRTITLTTGRYKWTAEFHWESGASLTKDRTIDLAAGDYWWNCRVAMEDPDAVNGVYSSYCYLYRVATGGYAYTPTQWFYVTLEVDLVWRSQLVRVGDIT